jgi:hypothetical protein
MPGVIQSRDLLRVLVFAAASRLSVHQACEQFERAPSGPTVLGNLACQLGDLDALAGHLNDLLASLIPKGLGKRGRRVAIDVIALPCHGTVDQTPRDEVCRSKAKRGTTHVFTYTTAYCITYSLAWISSILMLSGPEMKAICTPGRGDIGSTQKWTPFAFNVATVSSKLLVRRAKWSRP